MRDTVCHIDVVSSLYEYHIPITPASLHKQIHLGNHSMAQILRIFKATLMVKVARYIPQHVKQIHCDYVQIVSD